MNPLLQLIIGQLPGLVQTIRDLLRRRDPNAPEPTDAEVLAAFQEAIASSLAKDEQWLAAHPEQPE